jgi:hypothetical protein
MNGAARLRRATTRAVKRLGNRQPIRSEAVICSSPSAPTAHSRAEQAAESRTADERPSVPSVTYAEVHCELCLKWYPTGEFLKIIDSKQASG